MTDSLSAALAARGLPAGSAVLVGPPTPDAALPPEGPWVVMPYGGRYVVGAVGRGRFAEYDTVADLDAAVALVVRLLSEPARSVPEVDELDRRGAAARDGILSRTRQRGGAAGTAMLGAGEALDNFGPETGRHLYALGTPFEQRSQPPPDAGAAYHRYVVMTPLPEASEGVAAPWFGQPGGGAMVVLTKPIRWYVDHGHLVEVRDAP